MSSLRSSSNLPTPKRAQAVLNFWFDDPSDPDSEYGQQRKIWFKKDPKFDELVRRRFESDYENARAGELNAWMQSPRSGLALILLLDQIPRNIFRGSPRSFATDPQALAVARHGIDHRWDGSLIPVERVFLYLPFEHSENFADQNTSLQLFQSLVQDHPELKTTLEYAEKHRHVIQRFGRFPHRNAVLHRQTTPEEAEFLKQPGSGF